jgi:hypothetical protein
VRDRPCLRPRLEAAAGPGRNEHWRRSPKPLAQSAKAHPPPSLPTSAGPIPRSPTHDSKPPSPPNITPTPSGSGTGPERALEAITQTPRATARKLILPQAYLRAQDRSRGASPTTQNHHLPQHHTHTQRQRDRAGTSIGGDHPNPSRNSAKAPPPPSLPASAGPIPRSLTHDSKPPSPPNITPTPSGSGTGPERALKAITTTPRAKRESTSFPEPSCKRRTDSAEPRRECKVVRSVPFLHQYEGLNRRESKVCVASGGKAWFS